MTHGELVSIASGWLTKRTRCSVVITEMVTSAPEIPDAIGFAGGCSIVIECKASRADFLADADKPFRIYGGMGDRRYYLAPEGLIQSIEIPPLWGLLEVASNGKVKTVTKSERHEADKRSEVSLLISALRRIGQSCPTGVSVKCYKIETGRSATLGIEGLEESAA